MKVELEKNRCIVTREPGDKPPRSESDFWYQVKVVLREQGQSDGHMYGDEKLPYIRERRHAFYIYDGMYAVRDIVDEYKKTGQIELLVQRNEPAKRVHRRPRGTSGKGRTMKKNAAGVPVITLYANPYDPSANGWYFKTPEEFEDKYEKHLPVEEYELEWIDGPEEDRELFEALNVGPADLETFFDLTDDLRTDEKAALYYLLRYAGRTKSELKKLLKDVDDEVRVREGTSKEYVYDLVDDLGGVGELGENAVEMYFDYESFGRDLAMDLEEDDGLSDQERGEEYVDSMGGVGDLGEMAQQHFDFESYARDLELNGAVTEFDFAGTTYTTDYTG